LNPVVASAAETKASTDKRLALIGSMMITIRDNDHFASKNKVTCSALSLFRQSSQDH